MNIAAARMHAQRLTGRRFESAVDAVRWLAAVQSQDYGGAKWALGQRVAGATDADIDRLYDQGTILRTHVLRPTWHFVLPEDIRWLLQLTGPKIHQGLAGRYRQLELDALTIARAHKAFASALAGGRSLTRPELGGVLRKAKIAPNGQRLPHLLSAGELVGLLTSGPRRAKQHTFALLDERAPKARRLDRDEAIGELTRRYFRSHGPARVQDFVWWSGLTQAETRKGIELAGPTLAKLALDGKDYWIDADLGSPRPVGSTAHLLPNFDEYTVGYTDRSAILHPAHPFRPDLFAFSSLLGNVVTLGGQVCGAWKRVATRAGVRVEVRKLAELGPGKRGSIEKAAQRYGRFIGSRAEVAWL